jgi:hypothetical protein
MTKQEAKCWLVNYLSAATLATSLRADAYAALSRDDKATFFATMGRSLECEKVGLTALRRVARYFDEP